MYILVCSRHWWITFVDFLTEKSKNNTIFSKWSILLISYSLPYCWLVLGKVIGKAGGGVRNRNGIIAWWRGMCSSVCPWRLLIVLGVQCVICISAKATMQTFPCGHRVVCRKCFVKTIQMVVSQRMLPLRCVICRAKVRLYFHITLTLGLFLSLI